MRDPMVQEMASRSPFPAAATTATASGGPAAQIAIGDQHYLLRWCKKLDIVDRRPSLLTVIAIRPKQTIDRSFLDTVVRQYEEQDDVFRRECLEGILFQGADEREIKITEDAEDLMTTWKRHWMIFSRCDRAQDYLSPGPYYLDERGIFQLYRIHDDFNRAFLVSAVPCSSIKSAWEDGGVTGTSFGCVGVPVPSRLYANPSEGRPLDGVRIAVKDVYHMRGLKTSVCNRAYHDFYPPEDNTATCLADLAERGAQIVGKTHLSSFAWKEEPTECIEYQAPFNPRGDGYQSPAGSSSGSGAAIASYDWLDFTIGTDTTGSGRRPALWNGSFALRPSARTLSSEGLVPTCPPFDVPSFFGRDITKFTTLMRAWYSRPLSPKTSSDKPWTIIYPTDYLDIGNAEQLRYINEFTDDLARYLHAHVRKVSIEDEWEQNCPIENTSLEDYMSWVQEHGFYYDAYHCFDSFRDSYHAKHGVQPYVSPPTKWMWGIGAIVSREQREDAMQRFETFRKWFLDHVMADGQKNTLVILPIETLEPRYRDQPAPIPTEPPRGLSVLFLSPTLGSPELVIPVGHCPYRSKITNKKESLPVAVSVLAAPDMDVRLVELMEEFLKANEGRYHTKVKTGPKMW